MAIYRGTGGSIVGVDQADEFIISVGQGGTGADNVTDARTNLGLGSAAIKDETYFATAAQGDLADSALQSEDIGASVQAYDAQLTDVAGLTPTDNGVIIGNGSNFVVESGSTLRSSLGLAIGTDVLAPNGSAADLTNFPTLNQNTTGTADNVTGVVAIANGGTGQTTAATARAALLPSYATNGGKILAVKADASDVEYIEVSGTGTVTSVGMSVPTGLSVSGSPVTTTGTLAVTYSAGYAIPTTAKQTEWDTAYTDRNKWDGGSTGLDAATGRTSLGLGTAATTAATAYATAAQGTKADSAAQPASSNTFTANQIVSVTDNTNAALRITQLGTGLALRVEDETNPDSTPTVIDASGNVGIGTSSPSTKLDIAGTGSIASQITGTTSSVYRAIASTTGISYFACGDTDDVYVGGLAYNHTDDSLDISANNAVRATINSSGTFSLASTSGLSIGRTAVTSPASTDGNVFSGTYTPAQVSTNTNVDTVTFTANSGSYFRVGNMVTVIMILGIDATTSGAGTIVRFSLPVASNFSFGYQLVGTMTPYAASSNGPVGNVYADSTNDCGLVNFIPASSASVNYQLQFTYRVI